MENEHRMADLSVRGGEYTVTWKRSSALAAALVTAIKRHCPDKARERSTPLFLSRRRTRGMHRSDVHPLLCPYYMHTSLVLAISNEHRFLLARR